MGFIVFILLFSFLLFNVFIEKKKRKIIFELSSILPFIWSSAGRQAGIAVSLNVDSSYHHLIETAELYINMQITIPIGVMCQVSFVTQDCAVLQIRRGSKDNLVIISHISPLKHIL